MPNLNAMPWTEEDIEALRRMSEAGVSRADTALHFGRTFQAIKSICRKYKIAYVNPDVVEWTADDIRTLREMAMNGETDVEIGAVLNRTSAAVILKRRRLGIESKYSVADSNRKRAAQRRAEAVAKAADDELMAAELNKVRLAPLRPDEDRYEFILPVHRAFLEDLHAEAGFLSGARASGDSSLLLAAE